MRENETIIKKNQVGIVKNFFVERNFGFIKSLTGQSDQFMHASDLSYVPIAGDYVRFDVAVYNGRERAVNVCRIGISEARELRDRNNNG